MRRANIKSYLTPKVDPILKLSNKEATSYFSALLPHKNQSVHAEFGKLILSVCTRVLWAPVKPLTDVLPPFFSPEILDLLYIYLAKNKTNNPSQIAGCISIKRRGHWMLNNFGAVSLNQPVIQPRLLWAKRMVCCIKREVIACKSLHTGRIK